MSQSTWLDWAGSEVDEPSRPPIRRPSQSLRRHPDLLGPLPAGVEPQRPRCSSVNRKAEGRHRVEEVPLGDTALPPLASADQVPPTPLTPDLPGPFSVQFLDDHWFIGPPGAVQLSRTTRQWLHNWLAANGFSGPDALDFSATVTLNNASSPTRPRLQPRNRY